MSDSRWIGRIGAYRLAAEIGRGGVGTVYRAVDPTGRAVALKVLATHAREGAATERFLREAAIRIQHPNVVQTLGGGLDDEGRPYLVMELLEGQTLRDCIADLPPGELVEVVRQAALGAGALHARGIVHRDLKPENLFLLPDGAVKVVDLGIAAAMDGSARMTATGAVVGTPAYLAPEQARGERTIHPNADVWALGIVLYEGLAGESPFRRAGALATLLAVALDPVRPLTELAPDVSDALAEVVHRCLDRDPEARYASGDALAEALSAASRAESVARVSVPAPAPSVRRSVALVIARPRDRGAFEVLVRAHGGDPVVLLDGRAIGMFGGVLTRGDESRRAVAAARAIAALAPVVAVGVGRAEVGTRAPSGDAIRDAETALARAASGVVCGPLSARALATECALEEDSAGFFRISSGDARATQPLPLLGREVEVAMLRRARDRAHGDRSCSVTWIVGAAGAGKTRLAETAHRLASEVSPPMTVREAHAGAAPPTLFAVWAAALDLPPSRASGERLDPTARLDRAREEILEALAAESDAGPVAVVLEDVQWADAASLELVPMVAQHLADRPLWLVLTARSEVVERMPSLVDGATVIEPAPMGLADVVGMASARGDALPRGLAQELVDHTGGNPLFVEMLLEEWRESPERGVESLALPANVERAVQARLDQLPAREREAFVRLSMLGWPATPGELASLGCEAPEGALESLCERRLVARGAGAAGQRTYRPRSPLAAAVAASLPAEAEQVSVHRRAAQLGEIGGRDDEEVARHHQAGGAREAAARAFLRAALAANDGGDARKVLRCGALALELAREEVESFALHFALAEAARWAGEPLREDAALAEAERLATTDAERAMAASEQGDRLRRRGQYAEALARLARAVTLARASNDVSTLARAGARRATTRAALGDVTGAGHDLEELRVVEARLETVTRAFVEDTRGFIAGCSADHGERRRAFARAADLYQQAGDVRRSAGAATNAADAANRLGEYAEAERALRRAITASRRVGNRLTEGYALTNLGYSLILLGRQEEARGLLAEAAELAARIGDTHLAAAARLYAARATADESSDASLRALDAAGVPDPIRASALALWAERLLARGTPARALEPALAALEIRDHAGGLEEGEAEVFLAAVRALEGVGRSADAATLRERARLRIEELASKIIEPASRASFLERVSEHRALRT